MFNHMDTVESISELEAGQLIVIQRRQDKKRILVQVREILHGEEVLLSKGKNDYFIFDMYKSGKSWVWRVWALPKDICITAITNNLNEFPR